MLHSFDIWRLCVVVLNIIFMLCVYCSISFVGPLFLSWQSWLLMPLTLRLSVKMSLEYGWWLPDMWVHVFLFEGFFHVVCETCSNSFFSDNQLTSGVMMFWVPCVTYFGLQLNVLVCPTWIILFRSRYALVVEFGCWYGSHHCMCISKLSFTHWRMFLG